MRDVLRRLVTRLLYALFDEGAWWYRFTVRPYWLWAMYETTMGWGPNAYDWPGKHPNLTKRFHRWYWQGRCHECGGEGILHHVWVRGIPKDESLDMVCWTCAGSGNDEVT